jgi:hypothetical protein
VRGGWEKKCAKILTVIALNKTSLGSVFFDVKKITVMLLLDGGSEFFAARNCVP